MPEHHEPAGQDGHPPVAGPAMWDALRFAGLQTFARLPRLEDVGFCDVAVMGVPFDMGTSYRPGARFGPVAVREASRLLRPYNPAQEAFPFELSRIADGGDVACTPFDISQAVAAIERACRDLLRSATFVVALGGDHTIALPILRALRDRHGPLALVHFDAHLDTWDNYYGAAWTHGTPFRRAFEEGLLGDRSSMHVGVRGPLYSDRDLDEDAAMGFQVVTATEVGDLGGREIARRIRRRVGAHPVYVSIDIDVLDPAHAPGTGVPEAGGITTRELLEVVRALRDVPVVGADVVEVSPPYDHAGITAIAASHLVYELVTLLAIRSASAEGSAATRRTL